MISYKIVATGSSGNAILYENILVDCGIPFNKLKPYVHQIKLVLLTHEHKDHFNLKSIKELSKTAKIICCEWLSDLLIDIPHTVVELNKWVGLGSVKIAPFILYHDVKNCGWRIMMNGSKIFHATDTATLDGISAKDYDLYGLEFNYDEVTIYDVIDNKIKNNEFAYELGAIESHLSFQQAEVFINENAREDSKVLKLHMSDRYEE